MSRIGIRTPLAVFLLLTAALGLAGMTGERSEGHRSLPSSLEQRLIAGPPRPNDAPQEAESFYRRKRLGDGTRADLPAAAATLYDGARRQMEAMPRYSTGLGRFLEDPASRYLAARAHAPAATEWENLGPGNIGGRTRALVIDPRKPKTMYAAGVSGGVWKTTNGGGRWKPVGDQLANLAVNTLALDPNDPKVIYAGTGEGYFREEVRATSLPLRGGGIFRSVDGGATWQRLPRTNKRRFYWVNDLYISRHDSQRIYASTRLGVFRSLNGGANWKRVLRPKKTKGGCLDLAARSDTQGDYLFASCGTFKQASVYRHTAAEGPGKWTKVLSDPGMGRTSLAIAPSNQEIVYALAASNVAGPGGRFEQALHAVFRSETGGDEGSWQARLRNSDPRKINTLLLSNPIIAFLEECGFQGPNRYFAMGWYVNVIAVDPRDPDRLFAGGVDLLRSDDGGRNWNPASYWWVGDTFGSFMHADQHGLVFHPRDPDTLYVLNDGGIYRTRNPRAFISSDDLAVCHPDNSRIRWSNLNNNYAVTQFYHGAPFADGRSYLGGTQDNGTVLGTDARGSNRWRHILGGDGGYSAIDPTDPNVLYASTQNGLVHKSINGGVTFDQVTNGITELGGDGDFRAVADNFLFISPLVMDGNDSQRLWLGGRRLWRTGDGAGQWSAASAPMADGGKVSAIAIAPTDGDTVIAGTSRGGIYRSAAAGNSGADTAWTESTPRRGFVSSVAFDPRDAGTVYATFAGFGGEHVWRSLDGGESWQALDGAGPTSLPNIPVHALVVDPTNGERLYVGTDLGVFVTVDNGANWALENTGFAAAVTESLALAENGNGGRWLFAFTHGRGAWRTPL